MNISSLLRRSAQLFPDRPALLHGAQVLHDYRQLAARVAALAAFLRERCAVAPGDRVAIYSANGPEYLEAQHAIHWCGAVTVPVNYKLHARELAYVLQDSGARVLCTSPTLHDAARQACAAGERVLVLGSAGWEQAAHGTPMALHDAAPGDVAWLFYTSGTTGRPKGVMLTQRNLLAMTMAYFTDVDEVAAGDAMVYAAPMSHGAGLYNYAHLLRGARHVVPESGGFDPAELADLAARVGHLTLFAAPTMVHRLVAHLERTGGNGDGFKTIVYGGGPMYVEDLRRAMDVMGQKFVQIYGQGESPMTITALAREHLAASDHPRWRERIASVGVAHACVQVRVADADDCDLPMGEMGEVLVRGDTVMAGYWNNPDATATTLRGGWLHTGDIGSLDADGFLTLRDRSKDVIISGGSNIYPREVEEVLLTHPRVSEVAVVGERDADWGEIVVAFLVADGEPVPDAELDALCLAHIARFKRPKHYRWLPSLPKNAYGKVLKTELRAKVG
ncbi:MAG: AMP-binding protein [Comamonas sp.]